MTDAEIKKALRKEIKNYTNLGLGSFSFAKFCKEILNCINRLEAEAEKYYNAAKMQQDVSMKRFFEIKRLEEEIKQLQNYKVPHEDLKAENIEKEMVGE